jgi:hypothetical protein
VIRKAPPSGENNEQFRDCCIWDTAVLMATQRVVHLVSADHAFYESRNKSAGLASVLRAELIAARKDIQVHNSLRAFMANIGAGAAAVDEVAIGDSIAAAIMDQAREIAAQGETIGPGTSFELRGAHRPKIIGYATPKPSLVAISFEASFDLERTIVKDEEEVRVDVAMTLKGVCSYDPITSELSEIEIREWQKSLKSSSGGIWTSARPDQTALERQYGPGRMRFIS